MRIEDIEDFVGKLENYCEIEVEDSYSMICGDYSYWILSMLECDKETESMLEQLGFEDYGKELKIGKKQTALPPKLVYGLKRPELKNKWNELIVSFCEFCSDMEDFCDEKIFSSSKDHMKIALKWEDKICKNEADLRHFIIDIHSIFRGSIKVEQEQEIKGKMNEFFDFYEHLRNLRIGWAAHNPTELDNPSKWRNNAEHSFKELLNETPKVQLDWFNAQMELIDIGIENFNAEIEDEYVIAEISELI